MKYVFFLLLLWSTTTNAQVFVELGPGITNTNFSGELQVGYRYNQFVVSSGYIAMPSANEPVIFNTRAGMFLQERILIYAGYVRITNSIDDKKLNSNNWQAGAQYHFAHYDKCTFYIGATYTNPGYISAHVGMSWNLMKDGRVGCGN